MKESVKIYLIVLLFMSVITFVSYFIDKRRAINHKWRIKEATLWLMSFLGGSIGAILGMVLLRHKTLHLSFKVVNYGSLVIHIALGLFLQFGNVL